MSLFDTDAALLAQNPDYYFTDVQSLRRTIELQTLAELRRTVPFNASHSNSTQPAPRPTTTRDSIAALSADMAGKVLIGRVLPPSDSRNPFMDQQEEEEAEDPHVEQAAAELSGGVAAASAQADEVVLNAAAGVSTPLALGPGRVTAENVSRVLAKQHHRSQAQAGEEEEKQSAPPPLPKTKSPSSSSSPSSPSAGVPAQSLRRTIVATGRGGSQSDIPPLTDPLEPHAVAFALEHSVAALPGEDMATIAAAAAAAASSRPTSASVVTPRRPGSASTTSPSPSPSSTASVMPPCTPARYEMLWASLTRATHSLHEHRGLLKALQAELVFTRAEWETTLGEHGKCAGEKEGLQQSLTALRGEIRRIGARESALQSSLTEAQGSLRVLQDQFAQALDSSGTEVGALRSQLGDTLRRCSALESENSSLHSQVHSLVSENARAATAAQEQHNELLQTRNTLENARARSAAEASTAQRDRDELVRKIQWARNDAREAQGEKESLTKALEEARNKYAAVCRSMANTEEEAQRAQAALKEQSTMVATQSARINELHTELQNTTLALAASVTRQDRAEKLVQSRESEEASNDERVTSLRARVTELETSLAGAQSAAFEEGASWRARCATAENQARALQEQLDAARLHGSNAAQIASLQTELLRKQLRTCESSLAQAQEAQATLAQDLATSHATSVAQAGRIVALESERSTAQAAADALARRVEGVEGELVDVRSKYKSLKHAYASLQSVAKQSDQALRAREHAQDELGRVSLDLVAERKESLALRSRAEKLEKDLSEAQVRADHAEQLRDEVREMSERMRGAELEVAEARARVTAMQRAMASASATSGGVLPEVLEAELVALRATHAAQKVEMARMAAELARVKSNSEQLAGRAQLRRSMQMDALAPGLLGGGGGDAAVSASASSSADAAAPLLTPAAAPTAGPDGAAAAATPVSDDDDDDDDSPDQASSQEMVLPITERVATADAADTADDDTTAHADAK